MPTPPIVGYGPDGLPIFQKPVKPRIVRYEGGLPIFAKPETPSIGSRVLHGAEDFGLGVGAALADTVRGSGQLVNAGLHAVHLPTIPTADLAKVHVNAPDDAAGNAGRFVGDVAPFLIPGPDVAAALEKVGMVPELAAKAAPYVEQALKGGALNALQPARTLGGHAENAALGAGLGALGRPLDHVLSFAGRGIGSALKLFSKAGRKALGDRKFVELVQQAGGLQELATKLEAARSSVPGDVPTAAQAAGTVPMQQVERTLSKGEPARRVFAQHDVTNNGARVAQLKAMGGTDAQLQGAIDKRAAAFAPMAAKLADAWMSPATILKAAHDVAASNADAAPFAESLIHAVRAAQRASGMQGLVKGEWLRSLRTALHTRLNAATVGRAASADERRGVEALRNAVTDELDKVVPGFKAASARYAKDSEPVNAMQAAREALADVADRKQAPDGKPLVTAHDIQRVLDKDERAEFKLPASAKKKFADIRDSLLRDTRSRFNAGSIDKKSLTDALARTFASPWASRFLGESVLGGAVGYHYGGRHGALTGGILGMGLGVGGEFAGSRFIPDIASRAAEVATDSGEASRVLRSAIARQSRMGKGIPAIAHRAVRGAPAAALAASNQPLVIPISMPASTPVGQAPPPPNPVSATLPASATSAGN